MRTWLFIFVVVGLGLLLHHYFRRLKERRDPPPKGQSNPVDQWLTGRDPGEDDPDHRQRHP